MKTLISSGTAGGLFIFSMSCLSAQNPVPSGTSSDSTAKTETVKAAPGNAPQTIDTTVEKDKKHRFSLLDDASITGGQITLPFKIRRSPEYHTFKLTTDVTLGGYIGYTRKISQKRNYYLTVPLTAGLTFINLSDNNTVLDRAESVEEEVVPGLTWSTGVILQFEQYSLGVMFGKDYASNVGNQWEYHGKMWWSFGVGFVFLQDREE